MPNIQSPEISDVEFPSSLETVLSPVIWLKTSDPDEPIETSPLLLAKTAIEHGDFTKGSSPASRIKNFFSYSLDEPACSLDIKLRVEYLKSLGIWVPSCLGVISSVGIVELEMRAHPGQFKELTVRSEKFFIDDPQARMQAMLAVKSLFKTSVSGVMKLEPSTS